jgi:hypothetical protein
MTSFSTVAGASEAPAPCPRLEANTVDGSIHHRLTNGLSDLIDFDLTESYVNNTLIAWLRGSPFLVVAADAERERSMTRDMIGFVNLALSRLRR